MPSSRIVEDPSRPRVIRLRLVHRLLRPRDYQDRDELEKVEAWWRDSRCGLCALQGIGGAGKTAIADHFLRNLPGVLAPESGRPQRTEQTSSHAVFVFSFYEAPNADDFFRALAAWLIPHAAVDSAKPPYDEILYQLGALSSALIVLDGLEKVQDEGADGTALGRVNHAPLRELLRRAADGWLPNLGILVTTRFPLDDLRDAEADWTTSGVTVGASLAFTHFVVVEVGRLGIVACCRLLRRLGVRGTDEELGRIALDSGQHALSVDLVGGYVARFLGGDAPAALALPPLDGLEVPATVAKDPRSRYVQLQIGRFARLAARYHDAIARHDPKALALLQRAGLHALGVTAETLHEAHCIGSSRAPAHARLAGLTLQGVRERLEFLCELHLLENSGHDLQARMVYTMHPAVRDGFARTFGRQEASIGHAEAMRHVGALLDLHPGVYPLDAVQINRIEALIVHTSGAGREDEARSLYWRLLGGSGHLLAALGDAERGERLARLLDLPDERTLYLAALGRLQEALSLCQEPLVRAELLIRAGKLREAQRILTTLSQGSDPRAAPDPNRLALLATVDALRGDVARALRGFQDALPFGSFRSSIRVERRQAVLDLPTLLHCRLLERLGPDDEVERDVLYVRADAARQAGSIGHLHEPVACLLLARIETRRGNFERAASLVGSAQEWAVQHHAHEVLCEVWLERARLANARAQAAAPARHHYCGDALDAVREGLRLAIEAGYGLLAIDLQLEEALTRLLRREPDAAIESIQRALDVPAHVLLPAAADPECGYAWGEAKGLHLRARAKWLQQASRPDSDGDALRAEAMAAVDRALELRSTLRDPAWIESRQLQASLELGAVPDPPPADAPAPDGPALPRPAIVLPRGVFISYAHRDNDDTQPSRRWLDRLLEHLAPMSSLGELLVWSDRDLRPGEPWHARIRTHLDQAYAAVLLLSPSFLASGYIRRHELPLLLQRWQHGLQIIPVVVRPCDWEASRYRFPDAATGPGELELGTLQAPHANDEALSALPEATQDKVLRAVARRLRELNRQRV